MKNNSSLIIMGFLVVGLWYGIGYVQGADSTALADVNLLTKQYDAGFADGKLKGEANTAQADE